MNAHSMAAAAYGTPNTALKTARSTEYDIIARITARMRKAHAGGAMSFPALAEALTENRRLWIEFTVDLADPENPLPMALKGQLLSLANFTLNHTAAILEGRESAEVLIDINTAVMRGLAGKADVS